VVWFVVREIFSALLEWIRLGRKSAAARIFRRAVAILYAAALTAYFIWPRLLAG
jgi:hypothetical protein